MGRRGQVSLWVTEASAIAFLPSIRKACYQNKIVPFLNSREGFFLYLQGIKLPSLKLKKFPIYRC